MSYFKGADLKHITTDFLTNEYWEVIELDVQTNVEHVKEYYQTVQTKLNHLFFDFSYEQYLRAEITETYKLKNQVSNYIGNIGGWTVSWPIERDIPAPGQYQAKPEVYPELAGCDFYNDAKPMSHYCFGYMNTLLDKLTERALRQMLISKHPPGLRVLTHTDSKSIKLHLPFETNADAVFHFGPNGENRYPMEVGKLYLINPSVPHGTVNNGITPRTHLLSRVDMDFVPTLLSMQGIL
jgi:hypothetical protein